MSLGRDAYAYLVRSCRMTSSGDLVSDPDTVCFDPDLALEFARDEQAAGSAVYALGFNGHVLSDSPLASHGLGVPLTCASGAPRYGLA